MSMTEADVRPEQTPVPPQPGRPASPRQPVGTWPWLISAAVATAVVLSAFSLNGVLLGWSWLPQIVVSVSAVVTATALARVLRVPAVLIPVAAIATLIGVLTLLFFPGDSFLSIVPTAETLEALQPMLVDANQVVVSQVAPVQAAPGIVLTACAGLALVALLMDTLAASLQMPATSGLGLVAVLLVPAIVKPNSVGPGGFAAAILGYLLLLGCAHWVFGRRGAGGAASDASGYSASQLNRALAIGATALAATLILPLAVPGFSTGLFPEGSRLSLGTSSGLNPMVTLGNDLRNPGSVGRMTYTTTSDEPVYLRAVTLENFDGSTWEPAPREDERLPGVRSIESDTRDLISGSANFNTTRVDAGDFVSPWLLAPYAPVAVSGLSGQWSVDPVTLSIMGENQTTTANQSYSVTSITPVLTPETLSEASAIPPDRLQDPFLDLPADLPALIEETVADVTNGIDNRYRKAMAIQNYLRSEEFVYSETAPVQGGYDGSSMDIVARFLEEKSGYCVHYSAAMAVMARAEDIPSRIAVGYAPGTATGETITNENGEEVPVFEVDSDDAHAWPELYFDGLGWVKFEPTTSRGIVPDYAQSQSANSESNLNPDNLNPEALQSPSPDDPETEAAAPGPRSPGGSAPKGEDSRWIGTGVVLAAVLALLAAPYLIRRRIRGSRIHALRKEDDDATAAITAWREVNDTAMDHGAGARPNETPRTFTARLRRTELLGVDASAAMARLASAFERSEYGPPGTRRDAAPGTNGSGTSGSGTPATVTTAAETGRHSNPNAAAADIQLVNAAIRSNSDRSQRLSGLLLPTSLWRPWRHTRNGNRSTGPGQLAAGNR